MRCTLKSSVSTFSIHLFREKRVATCVEGKVDFIIELRNEVLFIC